MKVWLDDFRSAPSTWIHVLWPDEAIALLATNEVEHISLDHDLGDDERGTGYDVLLWIEEQVFTNPDFNLPAIRIHTANPTAHRKMHLALDAIKRKYEDS